MVPLSHHCCHKNGIKQSHSLSYKIQLNNLNKQTAKKIPSSDYATIKVSFTVLPN